ncbi:MAG: hypothetical protein QXD48_03410 [Candidatus Aenigmatarchaeota archaeon]
MDEINNNFWKKYTKLKLNKLISLTSIVNNSENKEYDREKNYFLKSLKKIMGIDENYYNELIKDYAICTLNKLIKNNLYKNRYTPNEDEIEFLDIAKKIKELNFEYYAALMKVYELIKKRENVIFLLFILSLFNTAMVPNILHINKFLLLNG